MSAINLGTLREHIPSAASMSRFAIFGAWFFVIVSLGAVGWIATLKWAEPASSIALYSATAGDDEISAWGLSYDGVFGLIWAMAQIIIVSAAAVLSVRGNVKAKRIAHGVLVGWAALWMLSLHHLARHDLQLDTLTQAAMASILFACTGYRAWEGWTGRRLGTSGQGAPALRLVRGEEESSLSPEMIEHSNRVEEVSVPDDASCSLLQRAASHARSIGGWSINAA